MTAKRRAPSAEAPSTAAAAPEGAPAAAPETPGAADPAPSASAATTEATAPPPAAVPAPTTNITAGPGGVMTDEVGVVTGDLTLRSELAGDQVTLHVQYLEADEWYKVTGGRVTLRDPGDLDAVHKIAVGLLNRPEG
jgi:hypothetical protein